MYNIWYKIIDMLIIYLFKYKKTWFLDLLCQWYEMEYVKT